MGLKTGTSSRALAESHRFGHLKILKLSFLKSSWYSGSYQRVTKSGSQQVWGSKLEQFSQNQQTKEARHVTGCGWRDSERDWWRAALKEKGFPAYTCQVSTPSTLRCCAHKDAPFHSYSTLWTGHRFTREFRAKKAVPGFYKHICV